MTRIHSRLPRYLWSGLITLVLALGLGVMLPELMAAADDPAPAVAPAPASADAPAAAVAPAPAVPADTPAATDDSASADAPAPATDAPVAAAPAAAAPVDCLECHEDAVEKERFARSIHHQDGAAACIACHGNVTIEDDEHEAPARVECGTCHKDVAAKAMAGCVHCRPQEDGSEPPSCQGCHGGHYIEPLSHLKNGARKALQHTMCTGCHKEAVSEYENGLHGRTTSDSVATCVDCHGAHSILPHSDPHSSTYRLNLSATCAACHMSNEVAGLSEASRAKVRDYFQSVHGLALSKSGLLLSATCEDCHGAHHIANPRSPGSPVARSNIPHTCGKCHPGVTQVYLESVHGELLAMGNEDVPVCTDCHLSHQIRDHYQPGSSIYTTNVAETCLRCHDDQRFITKYEFPAKRGQSYLQSYHGAASKLGDLKVANCASCHSSHDIRKSSDPKSPTHADNLGKTCGHCHGMSDADQWRGVGRIHLATARESHWITGMVERVYMGLIAFTIGFFIFFILLDLRHHKSKKH